MQRPKLVDQKSYMLLHLNFQVCFNNLHIWLSEMPGPPPPHHHPNQRLPPPGMGAEHPPWGGAQHSEFGPPPHGFNGHSPHMRHRQHPVQDDPSLVPNVPYFDLPAGLMAPLVKVSLLLILGRCMTINESVVSSLNVSAEMNVKKLLPF